jgi:hypothetical protein
MSSSKSILILLLSTTLFTFDGSRRNTGMLYNERQEILKGRVKRLLETGLSRGGGEFLMPYADSLFFDKQGNQLTEKGRFGTWQYQINFNFGDKDGHKSLELPWPRAISKRDYEFDDYRHLTELRYYNENGLFEKTKYIYNLSGQLIGVKTYDKKDLIQHKIGEFADIDHLIPAQTDHRFRVKLTT